LVGAVVLVLCAAPSAAARADENAWEPIVVTQGASRFSGKAAGASYPRQISIRSANTHWNLDALGSGIRKKFIFDVYEGVAYADPSTLGADLHASLVEGDIAKRVELHFVNVVEGSRIRNEIDRNLRKAFGEAGVPLGVSDAIDVLVSHLPEDGMKPGDVIDLTWLPGVGLCLVVKGEPKPPIRNADLAKGVWSLYFGKDPISAGLRDDLLRLRSKDDSP
jgi:hypothetical protein